MQNQNLINWILIVGGIILIICVFYACYSSRQQTYVDSQPEMEMFSPYESEAELNTYYEGSNADIKNYLVDTMVCSKKCCGDQWPVPFEGLTSAEIEQSIATARDPGPFVRTNYTCANGINGVGCPCISKDAYRFLVNKGRNSPNLTSDIQIEPTFLIDSKGVENNNQYNTPYENLQSYRSVFVNTPKLTDRELGRGPNPVNNVRPINDVRSFTGAQN